MTSFQDVIKALGGGACLARQIGENPVTVRQWANRDSIPSKYWPAIVAIAKNGRVTGINYTTLSRLAERARA